MNYQMEDIFKLIPKNEEKRIEKYFVKRNRDFLIFSPSIKYRGQYIDKIKICKTTFQHFGWYTLVLLFAKLLPSINNHFYEESVHPGYENKPSAHILSTTVADICPNYDPVKNEIYKDEKQYRSHNIRTCEDGNGYYLEWPHLSPISGNKYFRDLPNKSKEIEYDLTA